ncbi:hypothetical protein GX50_02743 [[Emmonsia] crescens]|uniref:Uncharacterized protein n=1 Tax=[Emmonsia] crescens TaxID=73230 RepID=A0A2B7ZK87_9EURO|nr:hypothetical protein GX50_02743 [Emmonsia crescens]
MGLPGLTWLQRALQHLFCAPGHRPAKQDQQDIATSTDVSRRTMGAGKCTVIWVSGQLNMPCLCSNVAFEVPLTSDSVQCKVCDHALSDHKDFNHTDFASLQQATTPQTTHQTPPQILQKHDPEGPQNKSYYHMPVAINSIENESLRISRDATVRALWKRVLEMGVVHIRGTPASGKSNMARILRLYVEKTSEKPIISLSWPINLPQNLPTNAM